MSSSRPETDPAADEDEAPDKSEGVEGTIAAAGRASSRNVDRDAAGEQGPATSAAGMNQPRVLRGERYRSCR